MHHQYGFDPTHMFTQDLVLVWVRGNIKIPIISIMTNAKLNQFSFLQTLQCQNWVKTEPNFQKIEEDKSGKKLSIKNHIELPLFGISNHQTSFKPCTSFAWDSTLITLIMLLSHIMMRCLHWDKHSSLAITKPTL